MSSVADNFITTRATTNCTSKSGAPFRDKNDNTKFSWLRVYSVQINNDTNHAINTVVISTWIRTLDLNSKFQKLFPISNDISVFRYYDFFQFLHFSHFLRLFIIFYDFLEILQLFWILSFLGNFLFLGIFPIFGKFSVF